ncbi:MAG: FAD-binding oxidoreductase [Alphaproteobacteria bacterium]|nr:FAD-binding oxidoreductase [Alphaproteobacteria bacterium]
MTPRVTVIGAGAVGVCSALWLQRAGATVTLIDRLGPGEGCSFGNAGSLSATAILPVAMPGVLKRVPSYLRDPLGPLTIRWAYLPRLLPWLLRFIEAGRRDRVERIAAALRSLLAPIFESYGPLAEAAGCAQLIRRDGCLYLFESQTALAAARWGMELRRRNGCVLEELPAEEIARLEPAIAPRFRHGLFAPDNGSTSDPHGLVTALARSFEAAGGNLIRAEVRAIRRDEAGARELLTDRGAFAIDRLVIAAGAWSRRLANMLGDDPPLETQRGYHVTLPDPGIGVNRNIMAVSLNIMVNPMLMGLRLAGTVELAGLDAPPNYARADAILAQGRKLFPDLRDSGRTQWMGHRPCLPDSLPVIDRAGGAANVVYAFGHGHVGMCAAPMTGRIVRDLVLGRRPEIDISPFALARF